MFMVGVWVFLSTMEASRRFEKVYVCVVIQLRFLKVQPNCWAGN